VKSLNTFYTWDRMKWRAWLAENFDKEKEVWFVFPKKESGEKGISYNDAVEEALCFGWIDSTVKKLDAGHRIQRFSPRRKGSGYSRANIERLIWLESQGMLHPKVRVSVLEVISEPYVFPKDILESIQRDRKAWENYKSFPASYQRIRIAYIDGARKRPEEFKRRLESFIRKTRENKLLGYGGIDKYYFLEPVEEKEVFFMSEGPLGR
jgi:uncharacterized protein YdeI (YjbR/CyaY-like superfamily)